MHSPPTYRLPEASEERCCGAHFSVRGEQRLPTQRVQSWLQCQDVSVIAASWRSSDVESRQWIERIYKINRSEEDAKPSIVERYRKIPDESLDEIGAEALTWTAERATRREGRAPWTARECAFKQERLPHGPERSEQSGGTESAKHSEARRRESAAKQWLGESPRPSSSIPNT